ncbi:MAG: PAS domain S-box protein [Anaerolineales bacterium]|jgi:PAS domain S-box-containing protein
MTDLSELSAEDLRGKLLEFQDRLADLERQNAELRRLQAQQPDEEDQRFHTLVEQAREGITLVNEQGYVILWNRAISRITGLAAQDVVGKLIWDVQFQLMPAEQRTPKVYKRLKSALLNFLETGQAPWADTLMEREYLLPDGSRIFIEGHVYAIRTEKGFILASVSQDISDRKRVEEALAASEEQFRTSIENLLDGFAIFSAVRDDKNQIVDFRYEYINEIGCRLNQRSREEQIGHTLLELLPAHKDSGIFEQYVRVAETGEPLVTESVSYEDIYGEGQGLARMFDFQAVKLGDGFIVTWRDVSERLKEQQALLEAEELARSTLDGLSAHIAIIDQDGTILAVNQAWRDFSKVNGGESDKTNEGANYLLVCSHASGANSDEAASFANGIRAVLHGWIDKFEMEYPCHAKDRPRWFVGRVTRFPSDGPPKAVIAHEDISERKLGEQALRQAHAQLSTLLEISQTVVSTLDLEPLLHLILAKLASVIGYSGAAVLTLDGDVLTVQAYRGPPLPVELAKIQVSISEFGEMQRLILKRQPLSIQDLNDHPRMMSEMGMLMGQPGDVLGRFRSWLAVPLLVKDVQIGIMVLTHRKANYYDRSARDMIQMFANHVAIAIQNAQLYRQAQASAALEERHRLARELHDSVAQALYSVNLYANATRRALVANKWDVVDSHLGELQRSTSEAVADMRLLIFELRPPVLDEEGLVKAIRSRLESVEARAGIEVSLQVDGEPRLSKAIETDVYRVIQEALNNILKHAHATFIAVKIKSDGARLQVTIQDNGKGFDPAMIEKSGRLGLRNIRERIHRIGGTFRLETAPGQGTSVQIEVEN